MRKPEGRLEKEKNGMPDLWQNREGMIPNPFYEARATWEQHLARTLQKGKLQAGLSHEHRGKNPKQNINKPDLLIMERITHHIQLGFVPGIQGCFNIWKSGNVSHYINRINGGKWVSQYM